MAMFIGIQKLWYGDIITTPNLTGANIATFIANSTTKEVANVHDDTWGYEESDPTVEEYRNQLTGNVYYRDKTQQGTPTISFAMGAYDFADKAALQGGTSTTTQWARPVQVDLIAKGVVALTKTNTYIVFPNANIIAKGNYVSRNITLGVQAVAMETGITNLLPEYHFDGSVVVTTQNAPFTKPAEDTHTPSGATKPKA